MLSKVGRSLRDGGGVLRKLVSVEILRSEIAERSLEDLVYSWLCRNLTLVLSSCSVILADRVVPRRDQKNNYSDDEDSVQQRSSLTSSSSQLSPMAFDWHPSHMQKCVTWVYRNAQSLQEKGGFQRERVDIPRTLCGLCSGKEHIVIALSFIYVSS